MAWIVPSALTVIGRDGNGRAAGPETTAALFEGLKALAWQGQKISPSALSVGKTEHPRWVQIAL